MRQYTIVAIWKHKRRRRHRESSHNFQWSTRSTKFVLSQPTLPRKFRITNGGLISFGSSLEMFDYFYKSLHYWPIDLNVNKLLLIRMQNKSETRGKLVFISSEELRLDDTVEEANIKAREREREEGHIKNK
ncbi:uncharacterized protein LOC126588341 isoform X2 [Malus sylvestris]|uniref:uncharacterized protein LOC126588341 isoform X2 n=1 Tax=Malus sylvestris TaxID=3752 RepID=UPI0021AC1DB8|nr:uncharacterized protein LOC126588341 isoform X2 [Malus sylvestris]